jgi:hypothetical protein
MKRLLAILLIPAACAPACGAELLYRGTWSTTGNRKLDGEMTCAVTRVTKETWRGHFHGTYQGAPFEYKVDFAGPANDVKGTATIDGVPYRWRGRITGTQFKANFAGSYSGSFDLKREKRTASRAPASQPPSVAPAASRSREF